MAGGLSGVEALRGIVVGLRTIARQGAKDAARAAQAAAMTALELKPQRGRRGRVYGPPAPFYALPKDVQDAATTAAQQSLDEAAGKVAGG